MNQTYPIVSTLLISISFFLQGCTTIPEKSEIDAAPVVEEKVFVSDFPTQDRVEYVLNCVAKHGGLSYVNQYACGCKIDKIAEKLTFKEYDSARTFSMLQSTPGEKGAVFRDPKQSKDLRTRLKEAEQYAEKACFVK